ncbi:hypothetical protein EDB86DRAFT_2893382 [Lactarius hatsudake]|nr:hypothetical protein EDB86DRAFT_2893382 [Lactarius hatsudake]
MPMLSCIPGALVCCAVRGASYVCFCPNEAESTRAPVGHSTLFDMWGCASRSYREASCYQPKQCKHTVNGKRRWRSDATEKMRRVAPAQPAFFRRLASNRRRRRPGTS